MKISTTRVPAFIPTRGRAFAPTEERFPHDEYRGAFGQPEPTFRDKLKSTGVGVGSGVAMGGAAGLAATIMGSPLYIGDPAVNPAVVMGWGIGVSAAVGAVFGLLAGSIAPGVEHLEAQQHYNDIQGVVKAGDLPAEESETLPSWRKLSGKERLSELSEKERSPVEQILSQIGERGRRLSAGPESAYSALCEGKLRIDGEQIDSLTELQFVDALGGGGLAILQEPKREFVEVMAGMSHRGFTFGRVIQHETTVDTDVSDTLARAITKAFENGFSSGTPKFTKAILVGHPDGTSFQVRNVDGLKQLDTQEDKNSAI